MGRSKINYQYWTLLDGEEHSDHPVQRDRENSDEISVGGQVG